MVDGVAFHSGNCCWLSQLPLRVEVSKFREELRGLLVQKNPYIFVFLKISGSCILWLKRGWNKSSAKHHSCISTPPKKSSLHILSIYTSENLTWQAGTSPLRTHRTSSNSNPWTTWNRRIVSASSIGSSFSCTGGTGSPWSSHET